MLVRWFFRVCKKLWSFTGWLHPAREALMYLFVINICNVLVALRCMNISFVNVSAKKTICFLRDRKSYKIVLE